MLPDADHYMRVSGAESLLSEARAALLSLRPDDPRSFLHSLFAGSGCCPCVQLSGALYSVDTGPDDMPGEVVGSEAVPEVALNWLRLRQCLSQRTALANLHGQASELRRQSEGLALQEPALRQAGAPYDAEWWDSHKLAPLREKREEMLRRADEIDVSVSVGRKRFAELRDLVRSHVAPDLVCGLGRYEEVFDDVLARHAVDLDALDSVCAGLPRGGEVLQEVPEGVAADSFDALLSVYRGAAAVGSSDGPFHRRVTSWAAGVGEVLPAPLKAATRALEKVYEEYDGLFTKLLDVARASVVVDSPGEVARVVAAIRDDAGAEVVRVKHRLSPSFDAAGGGGYRDVLLNVRVHPSRHICEVQVHLRALLDVKRGGGAGGHRTYRAARTLRALDELVTRPVITAVSAAHLTGVSRGVVQRLQVDGLRIGPDGASSVRSALEASPHAGAALRQLSMSCCADLGAAECATIASGLRPAGALRYLSLHTCASLPPEGVTCLVRASPLLSSLNLRYCRLVDDDTVGVIGQCCPRLRTLILRNCTRVTDVGASWLAGGCRQLTHLNLRATQITDAGLAELVAGCRRLRRLDLSRCERVSEAGLQAAAGLNPVLSIAEIGGAEG